MSPCSGSSAKEMKTTRRGRRCSVADAFGRRGFVATPPSEWVRWLQPNASRMNGGLPACHMWCQRARRTCAAAV